MDDAQSSPAAAAPPPLPAPGQVPVPAALAYETPAARVEPEFLQPWVILVDVLIVFGLTFAGGCFVGVFAATAGVELAALVVAATNLVRGSLGFTISGLRAPRGNRWRHLACVAVGVWLTGLVNVAFGVPPLVWAVSIVAVAAMMGIGGAISIAVRK